MYTFLENRILQRPLDLGLDFSKDLSFKLLTSLQNSPTVFPPGLESNVDSKPL